MEKLGTPTLHVPWDRCPRYTANHFGHWRQSNLLRKWKLVHSAICLPEVKCFIKILLHVKFLREGMNKDLSHPKSVIGNNDKEMISAGLLPILGRRWFGLTSVLLINIAFPLRPVFSVDYMDTLHRKGVFEPN